MEHARTQRRGRREVFGEPKTDAVGTVRRDREGKRFAFLIPGPPKMPRWIVSDWVGSCGYEDDDVVKHWPIVGVVPFSPAAGVPLDGSVPTPTHVTVNLPARAA